MFFRVNFLAKQINLIMSNDDKIEVVGHTFLNAWYNSAKDGPQNTFQIIVTTDGKYSFAIMNYQLLEWANAPAEDFAVAGYTVVLKISLDVRCHYFVRIPT